MRISRLVFSLREHYRTHLPVSDSMHQSLMPLETSESNFLSIMEDCASHKELCQLEGSDCGGRDRRPSWHWRALSFQASDGVLRLADVWAPTPPSTRRIIHLLTN